MLSDGSPDATTGDLPTAMQESLSDDYFHVLGLPLREGRLFEPHDGAGAPAVGIVSDTMARRLWPGTQAIGHRIRLPGSDTRDAWINIVGVVADTRHEVYDRSFRSILYRPLAQVPSPFVDFALRTSSDRHRLISIVRSAVAELDTNQPITHFQTMEERSTSRQAHSNSSPA